MYSSVTEAKKGKVVECGDLTNGTHLAVTVPLRSSQTPHSLSLSQVFRSRFAKSALVDAKNKNKPEGANPYMWVPPNECFYIVQVLVRDSNSSLD